MTPERKLRKLRKALRTIVSYPTADNPRRTPDGYPSEFVYDEFAYKRIVDSFRESISEALAESLDR